MKKTLTSLSLVVALLTGITLAEDNERNHGHIKRVLLISIDGMHAVDFANCANGINTANNGDPYCPALAASKQEWRQLRCRNYFQAIGFFPGIDRHRHRWKPGADRRLLRRGVLQKLRRAGQDYRQRRCCRPLHSRRNAHRHHHGIRRRHRHRSKQGEWRRARRITDRRRPRIHRPPAAGARSEERLQPSVPLGIRSRQQYLQRHSPSWRIRGMV